MLRLWENVAAGGPALRDRALAEMEPAEAAHVAECFAAIEAEVRRHVEREAVAEARAEAAQRRLLGALPRQHARYRWRR